MLETAFRGFRRQFFLEKNNQHPQTTEQRLETNRHSQQKKNLDRFFALGRRFRHASEMTNAETPGPVLACGVNPINTLHFTGNTVPEHVGLIIS